MKTGIGVGVAALAAAAAGVYYYCGSKHAARHRRGTKSWLVKAKGEVMEKLGRIRDVTEQSYNKAVSQVVDKYKIVKQVRPKELALLAAELKGSWKRISSHLKAARGAAKRTAAAR